MKIDNKIQFQFWQLKVELVLIFNLKLKWTKTLRNSYVVSFVFLFSIL